MQRDRDKQARAREKQERRQQRATPGPDESDEETPPPEPQADQAVVLEQLAQLHAAFDDGKLEFDEFEERRDELTSQLRID